MNFFKKAPPQTLVNIDTVFPFIQEAAVLINREGKLILINEKASDLFNRESLEFTKIGILDLIPSLRNTDEWRMILNAPDVSAKSVTVKISEEYKEATLIPAGREMNLSALLIFHPNVNLRKEATQQVMRITENIGKNMLSQKQQGIQESLKEIGEFLNAERLSVLKLHPTQNHDKVVFDSIFVWVQDQNVFFPIVDKIVFNLSDPKVRDGLQKLQSGKITELPGITAESNTIPQTGNTLLLPIMLQDQFLGALSLEMTSHSDPLQEFDLFPLKLLSCAIGLWMDRVQEVSEQTILIQEKEAILGELHHRSKNNLAILAGFIDLFENSPGAMTTREFSRNIRDRIQALALIYEVLSSSSELSKLSIQKYLEMLVFRIESSLVNNRRINKIIRAGSLYFRDIDQMITVGLLINEICLNAYHHGLGEAENPQFVIEVNYQDEVLICKISDNGPGLPENWDAQSLPNTLGFTIIKGLINQLKSSYQILPGPGCTFLLKIKGLEIGE